MQVGKLELIGKFRKTSSASHWRGPGGRTMEIVYSAAAFVGQCQGPGVTLGQRAQSIVQAGYSGECGQPSTHWHLGVHLSPWMTMITFWEKWLLLHCHLSNVHKGPWATLTQNPTVKGFRKCGSRYCPTNSPCPINTIASPTTSLSKGPAELDGSLAQFWPHTGQ